MEKIHDFTVLIVDDSEHIRAAVKEWLADFDITTIAEAENGLKLLELLATGVSADVVLLDLKMPVMDGNQTFDVLRIQYPQQKVIVMSTFGDQELMKHYIKRGAGAFVVKDQITTNADYLVRVIKKVVKMGSYPLFMSQNEQAQLTTKQIELIAHMIEGNSKSHIADSLGITLSAVEKAEKRIMAKYNAKSRIGLIVEMVEKGYQFFAKRLVSQRKTKSS